MTDTVTPSEEIFVAPEPPQQTEPQLAAVSALLKRTADVNAEFKDGNTYLHIVVAMQKENATKVLLENGADPNKKNHDGLASLPIALKLKNVNIAKLLVDKGANVDEVDGAGNSLLHMAVILGAEDALRLLLDSGADPKKRNSGGLTALQVAIKLRMTKLGLMLIEMGADVNEADDATGTTLLHLAVAQDDPLLIHEILARKPNVEARTTNGETALHLAAGRRNSDRISVMEKLLFQQADINAKCNLGETPLMRLLWTASGEDVQFFFNLAADVRAKNIYGETGLHLAAELGNDDAVLMLLRLGSNVNLEDYKGNTAVHSASCCCQADTIQLLHTRGAKCGLKNLDGKSPLTLLLDSYRTNPTLTLEQVSWTVRTLLFYSTTEFWSFDGRTISDLEEAVWKPIVEHLARLSRLNKYPSENLIAEVNKNPKMKEYYWMCKNELCQAANSVFKETMSFFGLLKEQQPGFNFHQHEAYKDAYEKADFDKFPIYGEIMKRIG